MLSNLNFLYYIKILLDFPEAMSMSINLQRKLSDISNFSRIYILFMKKKELKKDSQVRWPDSF